jgi:hypothetical protein
LARMAAAIASKTIRPHFELFPGVPFNFFTSTSCATGTIVNVLKTWEAGCGVLHPI